MRRFAARVGILVVLATVAAGCAAPTVTLRLRYQVGKVRTYEVKATVHQSIDVGGLQDVETVRFEATTRVEVLDVGTGGATVRVKVTPTLLERDGQKGELPAGQEVTVQVGEDGSIADIESASGAPVRADDLVGIAPLIGASLPTGRVRLADRWRRPLQPRGEGLEPGIQMGRLAAYRVVQDRDCAVVELDSRRELTLTRQAAGRQLNLSGIEVTATQVALDFAEGFPVEITAEAEGRFAVEGAPSRPGDVVIRTDSVLRLVS